MAYNVSTEGMDELSRTLGSLGNAAQGVAAAALYEGAGMMADAVSSGIEGISTDLFRYAKDGQQRKPSPEEKAILRGAGKAGIAKFTKGGTSVDTSVGFNNAGYAAVSWKTRKSRTTYEMNGQTVKPVPMIANAINSGTSFMQKQPFFRKAVSRTQAKAKARIESEVLRMLEDAANKQLNG